MKEFLCFVLVSLFGSLLYQPVHHSSSSARPLWMGKGKHRLLVRVDALPGTRREDEMPGEVVIDFQHEVARQLKVDGQLDIASIQVVQYNRVTGKPIPFVKNAYASIPGEVPSRWYDDAIPYDFPEFETMVAKTDGQTNQWKPRPKWGYFYGTVGEGHGGRLAWAHTQKHKRPSYYAIYFDVLATGSNPKLPPPQGFLGMRWNVASRLVVLPPG